MSADSAPGGDAAVPPVDVEAAGEQLTRLLESTTFAGAPRARSLVSFVVTETLAGRGDALNERVITRVALGRPATVDTRVDASGRVQASRARELLERYYAGEGRTDPVVITIPRGQYAAVFSRARTTVVAPQAPAPASATRTGPTVAIANLGHHGSNTERRVAFGLVETLIQIMTSFPGITVVGPINVPRRPVGDSDLAGIAERTGATHILHGRVHEIDGVLRISVRLVDAVSGAVKWSEAFDRDLDATSGLLALDDVAARIAAVVGDFNGVMLRDDAPHLDAGVDPFVADAIRRYYSFLADLGPETESEVVDGLEEALRREPDNVTALGCLASVHAVSVLMRGAAGAGPSLLRAEALGNEVLAADPANAIGHNVLAIVMLARGRRLEADQHARRVLELTPFHPGNVYGAGMVIGACGDWDGGIAVIRRAVALNPYGPSHYRTLLAVDGLLRDDVAEALAQASLVRFPAYPYGPLLRYICLSELGLAGDAQRERDELVGLVPFFFEDPAAVLSVAPTLPSHAVDHLVARLERAEAAASG
jgi:TolB-like protein